MKKKICFTLIIALTIWITVFFKSDRKPEEKVQPAEVVEEATQTPDSELHFDTYEDLKNDKAISSGKTKENSHTKEKEVESDRKSSNGSKAIDTDTEPEIIDESDETMKDETVGENDYDGEPQGKIKLHKPKQEEGKEVDGDIAAGGKQGVGTWD